jgi:hypothetical protein
MNMVLLVLRQGRLDGCRSVHNPAVIVSEAKNLKMSRCARQDSGSLRSTGQRVAVLNMTGFGSAQHDSVCRSA